MTIRCPCLKTEGINRTCTVWRWKKLYLYGHVSIHPLLKTKSLQVLTPVGNEIPGERNPQIVVATCTDTPATTREQQGPGCLTRKTMMEAKGQLSWCSWRVAAKIYCIPTHSPFAARQVEFQGGGFLSPPPRRHLTHSPPTPSIFLSHCHLLSSAHFCL